MKIKVKKLNDSAIIPSYANDGDAGMDIIATSVEHTEYYIEYSTGLSFEVPEGYVMLIFPRSSCSKYDLQLCNSVGVLDSTYRGELKFRFRRIINEQRSFIIPDKYGLNASDTIYKIKADFHEYEVGDKIGQIMIIPYPKLQFEEVSELSQTKRGTGGFGSTGK